MTLSIGTLQAGAFQDFGLGVVVVLGAFVASAGAAIALTVSRVTDR